MTAALETFLALPEQDKRDVFSAAAVRLDTLPSYVEKDFWVCFVLDALYNRLPDRHPRLIFKGGTSLSKAFGLIQRFSEDIDLVVPRDGLGFDGERDPTIAGALSNKKRNALFKEAPSPFWPMKASMDAPPTCPPRPGPAISVSWGRSAGRRFAVRMVSRPVARGFTETPRECVQRDRATV